MTQKHLNSRFVQKHDYEYNWIKAGEAENPFIPLKGEIIVYDADDINTTERFKIGDGVKNINELEFTTTQADWDEINSNSPAFIKNKPFGVVGFETVNIIDNVELTNWQYYPDENTSSQELTDFISETLTPIPSSLTIIFDDIEYHVQAQSVEEIPEIIATYGNASIVFPDFVPESTNEPFVLILVLDENDALHCMLIVQGDQETTIHNITINAQMATKVKTIDLQYLPPMVSQDDIVKRNSNNYVFDHTDIGVNLSLYPEHGNGSIKLTPAMIHMNDTSYWGNFDGEDSNTTSSKIKNDTNGTIDFKHTNYSYRPFSSEEYDYENSYTITAQSFSGQSHMFDKGGIMEQGGTPSYGTYFNDSYTLSPDRVSGSSLTGDYSNNCSSSAQFSLSPQSLFCRKQPADGGPGSYFSLNFLGLTCSSQNDRTYLKITPYGIATGYDNFEVEDYMLTFPSKSGTLATLDDVQSGGLPGGWEVRDTGWFNTSEYDEYGNRYATSIEPQAFEVGEVYVGSQYYSRLEPHSISLFSYDGGTSTLTISSSDGLVSTEKETSTRYGTLGIEYDSLNASGKLKFPQLSGQTATIATLDDINTKLDLNILKWNGNVLRSQPSGSSIYSAWSPTTFSVINGTDTSNKSSVELQGFASTRGGKYRKFCGSGIYDKDNHVLLFPELTSNKTIGLKEDIDATNEHISDIEKQIEKNQERTGEWYSADVMQSIGQTAVIGRMYVCTGSGVTIQHLDGAAITATDGTNLSSTGHKAVAFILPNQLSSSSQRKYRCKMIAIDDGVLAPSFEAKDFILDADITSILIKATGGTSIWTV